MAASQSAAKKLAEVLLSSVSEDSYWPPLGPPPTAWLHREGAAASKDAIYPTVKPPQRYSSDWFVLFLHFVSVSLQYVFIPLCYTANAPRSVRSQANIYHNHVSTNCAQSSYLCRCQVLLSAHVNHLCLSHHPISNSTFQKFLPNVFVQVVLVLFCANLRL